MKIGNIDIKKAYLGSLELTNKNAFVGEVPVIEGGGILVPLSVTETHTVGQYVKLTEYDTYWYYEVSAEKYWSFSANAMVELPYECESIKITLARNISTQHGYTEYTRYINDTQYGSTSKITSSTTFTVVRPSGMTSSDIWKISLFGTTNGTVSATQSTCYVKWTIPKSVV